MLSDLPQSHWHDNAKPQRNQRWDVIERFFSENGFVQQQIQSMNHFVYDDLPAIIKSTPPLRIFPPLEHFTNTYVPRLRHFYEITFDDVYLDRPCTVDQAQNPVPLYPQQARDQGLNYSAPLYVYMTTRQVGMMPDGSLRERKVTREPVYVGHFPIMVHSDHCWLSDTMLNCTLPSLRECVFDQGGYFIVHGKEKALVAQEHIRLDRIYVFKKKRGNRSVLMAEVRSCRDAHLQLVKPLMVILNTEGADPKLGLRSLRQVQIGVRIPYMSKEIEPVLLFKALGVIEEAAILRCIALQERHAHVEMLLHASFRATEHITTQEAALIRIGHLLSIPTKNARHQPDDDKALSVAKTILSRDLLPHLTTNNDNTPAEFNKKAFFLGHLIMKLIEVYHDPSKRHDRDHYANKRVDMGGPLFRVLFAQQWQKVVKDMRVYLRDALKNSKPIFLRPRRKRNQTGPAPSLKTILMQAVKTKTITQGLRFALSTGKWPHHDVYRNNSGVAQELNRMTFVATLSHLRRINTPLNKKTGKMTKPRQLHNTHHFLLCAVETPEGAPCGIIKNFALLCCVSTAVDATAVVSRLQNHADTTLTVALMDMDAETLKRTVTGTCKLFVNGDWIGMNPHGRALFAELRALKRSLQLHPETSIVYREDTRELHVSTTEGRPMHPVLVVEHDLVTMRQRLALRQHHVERLKYSLATNYGWRNLLHDGVVELLDCEELEQSMVAMEFEDLEKNAHIYYTHCELHPAMQMGVCGSLIPLAEHNQSPRNMYQCLDIETPVLLRDGTTKPIKRIEVGDIVKTFDPVTLEMAESPVVYHYVRRSDKPLFELTTTSGRILKATHDHRIMTTQGWMRVDAMVAGETLVGIVPHHCDNMNMNRVLLEEYNRAHTLNAQLSFKKWRTLVSFKGAMLFVPLASKICISTNPLISDFTVASEHHSFIANEWAVSNCAMGKQAIGVPSMNYMHRFDTLTHVLDTPMKPLVSTRMANMLRSSELPSGQNIIIAIMAYKGYNQEDAIIMNQSAIERGLFRSTLFRTFSTEAKRGRDTFECPLRDDTLNMQHGNYDKLEANGEVLPGTRLKEYDIVIGKTTTPRGSQRAAAVKKRQAQHQLGGVAATAVEKVKTDKSVAVGKNEGGVVERVMRFVTPKTESKKVRLRSVRVPERGDKFASRHGQKGTIGLTLRQEDMPYTVKDGIVPDIIMNPHGLTSRMTMGHLQEILIGKSGALSGEQHDCTPFDHDDVETFMAALKECGYSGNGNERMIHPQTGHLIEGTVLIGPIYYQKLRHMVQDKIHARSRGALRALTRQPTEGKKRHGGLRCGEMERDCFIAHGASAIMRERLFTQSDPYALMVCERCGFQAIRNIQTGRDWCIKCDRYDGMTNVNMPYAFKLLLQELMALHFSPRLASKAVQ